MSYAPTFRKTLQAITSLGLVSMLAVTMNAHAIQVYKSVGKNGEVRYTQYEPRDTKNFEVIEFRSDGRQVTPGNMAGKTNSEQQTEQPTAEEQRIANLENRLAEQEAQANAERCQSLRNQLTNLNVGGRVYEMDADGNRKYLDSEEMEQRTQRIQQAMSQYCNGQTT